MARTSRKNMSDRLTADAKRITWKVALYIRLSREDGNTESMSVINQKIRLAHYLKTAFVGEYELIDIFVDDGISGTTFDRKAFQLMKEGILNGEINCVIVKDISRLGRNSSECGYYLGHFFVECNTRFISLDLPAVDSYLEPDQMNSIVLDFMNIVNEDFARQTSQKVRSTFHQKRSEGKFIGSTAPYGYKKDPLDKNALIVDEEAAQIVRDIFRMYVHEDMSKRGVMQKLNSLGIPCPTQYKRQQGSKYQNPHTAGKKNLKWSEITITTILKNQMYLGHMVQGKQRVKSYKVKKRETMSKEDWYIVPDTHEPIVARELFDAAQKLMQRDTKTAPQQGTVHLFSGFLKCADCGRAMTRRTARGHVYYACRTYTDAAKDGKEPCKKHSIRLDRLEKAVLVAIQMQIGLVISLSETIDQINDGPTASQKSGRLDALLKARKNDLEKYQNLCDDLYPDMKSGLITCEEYQRMKATYQEKMEHAKEAIDQISKERGSFESGIEAVPPYFEQFMKHQNVTQLDRTLLIALVDTIYIHEGGDITIQFVFDDQHQRLLEFIENNQRELTVLKSGKVTA